MTHGFFTRATASVLMTAAVALCCGCRPGTVEAVTADHANDSACTAAAKLWPTQVASQKARKVTSTSATVRAWGDPAIIARCGVTSPGATTDPCFGVSGVDWVGHQLDDGYRFVTFGRSPAIEVLVPSHYSPEPLVLGAFTAAAKKLTQGPHHCT